MSLCTEQALSEMIAEDMHKLKTQKMDARATIALVLEIKNMDLFRQRLALERELLELEAVP